MALRTREERQKLFESGPSPTTRIGASGDRGSAALTEKGVQTGGAGDGTSRRRSATGTVGSGTRGTRAGVIKTGRTPVGEGPLGFAFKASAIGREGGGRRGRGKTGDIPSVNIPEEAVNPATLGKPIRSNAIDNIKNVRATAPAVGGTSRKDGRTINARSPEFQALKAGEGTLSSVTREKGAKRGRGGFTDLGEFKKGGKTLREISQASSPGVSPFSQKGIGQLFGSASELARLFSSKEFQQRKAKGIQSAAGVKGRRADNKALNEKAKTLSAIKKDAIEGGESPDSDFIQSINKQLSGIVGGGGISTETVSRLAEAVGDDDLFKTILGIIK